MTWRRNVIGAGSIMASASALASPLASGSEPTIPWARILLAFIFCATLAWGAILLFHKHRGAIGLQKLAARLPGIPGPPSDKIELVETQRASPHCDICLVRCNGQEFLLAITPHNVSVLDRREEVPSPTTEPSAS